MNLWWCYRGDQTGAPYSIAVTRAEGHTAACETFGEPEHATTVHELSSPVLVRLLHALAPGGFDMITVDRLPGSYDRFVKAGGGFDFDAMDDAGH